jgi:hypothetical protein
VLGPPSAAVGGSSCRSSCDGLAQHSSGRVTSRVCGAGARCDTRLALYARNTPSPYHILAFDATNTARRAYQPSCNTPTQVSVLPDASEEGVHRPGRSGPCKGSTALLKSCTSVPCVLWGRTCPLARPLLRAVSLCVAQRSAPCSGPGRASLHACSCARRTWGPACCGRGSCGPMHARTRPAPATYHSHARTRNSRGAYQ